jgi:hypothetical protein
MNVPGQTSYSNTNGTISVSYGQFDDTWDHARFIALHEFGHQVAFRHGAGRYLGDPPAGFPYRGVKPEEVWGECFATALTGVVWPSYGYPACDSTSLRWTRQWIDRWR